ncbi:YybH family protein [Rubrivirga sp. IMCC43871]|uniref:YybH family protein n=1 Tax=Rubrivirga sp. IMCC43871 TaxID=3391575 RepID=UPI003990307D
MRALTLLALLLVSARADAQAVVVAGDAADIVAIAEQSKALSAAYVAGDIDALVAVYAEDGIAAPGGRDFIRGYEALRAFWTLPEGRVVTRHQAVAEELRIAGDLCYDWGYYEGEMEIDGEARPAFRGKYLIVWQRDADGVWRIAHDMWNSLPAD